MHMSRPYQEYRFVTLNQLVNFGDFLAFLNLTFGKEIKTLQLSPYTEKRPDIGS